MLCKSISTNIFCRKFLKYVDVSKNRGTPKWMVKMMETPIKLDDLGVPLFFEMIFSAAPWHGPLFRSFRASTFQTWQVNVEDFRGIFLSVLFVEKSIYHDIETKARHKTCTICEIVLKKILHFWFTCTYSIHFDRQVWSLWHGVRKTTALCGSRHGYISPFPTKTRPGHHNEGVSRWPSGASIEGVKIDSLQKKIKMQILECSVKR